MHNPNAQPHEHLTDAEINCLTLEGDIPPCGPTDTLLTFSLSRTTDGRWSYRPHLEQKHPNSSTLSCLLAAIDALQRMHDLLLADPRYHPNHSNQELPKP